MTLGLAPPPAGQAVLRRRVGEFERFAADLTRRIEQIQVEGEPLGRAWDVEGDPSAALLVDLWAYVAEIVAAYTELTAGEAYLQTAADWTDLRRLAGLVGYKPRPRIAAQGYVRFEVDRGVDPLVPAGTRVQAPATPEREAQTFEVASDTQLRSDWDRLTATWVPVPGLVEERHVRLIGDPGFGAGDLVLFVKETPSSPAVVPPQVAYWTALFWAQYFGWMLYLATATESEATPLAVAGVVSEEAELGTTVVEFDRELGSVLESPTEPYAAYRVTASAGQARRLSKVLTISGTTVASQSVEGQYSGTGAITATSIVLDAELEDLSAGQTVAVVDWTAGTCDIVEVAAHKPVTWEVAPGTPTRTSQLEFAAEPPVATLSNAASGVLGTGPLTVYVLDRRVVARHHEFPSEPKDATAGQLRIHPEPAVVPERIAVQTIVDDKPTWEVLACRAAEAQEATAPGGASPSVARGLILDLVGGAPKGSLVKTAASGNLAPVRHGATATAVVGSGDATQAGQRFTLADAPVAYDVDDAGTIVPSQDLRANGLHWDEVPSLYGQGRREVFTAVPEADGGITVQFGDGDQGARLPTGRGNVRSTYRVGGGTAGELESGAIDSLLGSVRGVKKAEGAGPTSGGADQDDERDLRTLVPARARAFGRAISVGDLVDLTAGYPGVTHAAAWNGSGPPGCSCGGVGLHLAFIRAGAAGPRAPEPAEVGLLASFLDARRDATVPLCVCGGTVVAVAFAATLATDPRRLVDDVVTAAHAAVFDPAGALAPLRRSLGQPLDRSDVYAVLHGATGVVGVTLLSVDGAVGEIGRRPAERYELIAIDEASTIGGSAA
jgi:Baseplate J-like protein